MRPGTVTYDSQASVHEIRLPAGLAGGDIAVRCPDLVAGLRLAAEAAEIAGQQELLMSARVAGLAAAGSEAAAFLAQLHERLGASLAEAGKRWPGRVSVEIAWPIGAGLGRRAA